MKKVLLFISTCFFFDSQAQVMHGRVDSKKVLKFNSNYLIFAKPIELLIMGKMVKSTPSPIKINNIKIYDEVWAVDKSPKYLGKNDLSVYLFQEIQSILELLPDGNYVFHPINLVVNERGRLAYFDFYKLRPVGKNMRLSSSNISIYNETDILSFIQNMINKEGLNEKTKKTPQITVDTSEEYKLIEAKLYHKLYQAFSQSPSFSPAIKNGEKVNCLLYNSPEIITVKNHNVTHKKMFKGPNKKL